MTEKKLEHIKIIGLPKGSVLWPTAAFACISGLIGLASADALPVLSGIFLVVFTFNLLILFFDFSRGSIFGIAGLLIAAIVIVTNYEINFLKGLQDFLESGIVGVSAQFLIMFGTIFLILLLLAIFIRKNFQYYEISSNEIIRKEGFLGDAQRFNSTDLQIDKAINDVFESLLLFGSGDLIITTVRGHQFHILNVPRINHVEKRIRRLLGKIEVETV